MADKIASGVYSDGPILDYEELRKEERLAKLRGRREKAVWSATVGILILFSSGFVARFAVGMVVGGVLMVAYGAVAYILLSAQMSRIDNPWHDPEIDAWEQEEFGR